MCTADSNKVLGIVQAALVDMKSPLRTSWRSCHDRSGYLARGSVSLECRRSGG